MKHLKIIYELSEKRKNTLTSPPFLHQGNGSGIQQFCLHQKQSKDRNRLGKALLSRYYLYERHRHYSLLPTHT